MKPKLPTAPKTLKILQALKVRRSRGFLYSPLTVAYALNTFGVYALSQEIGRRKELGWKIESSFIKTHGGAHVKQYYLA